MPTFGQYGVNNEQEFSFLSVFINLTTMCSFFLTMLERRNFESRNYSRHSSVHCINKLVYDILIVH